VEAMEDMSKKARIIFRYPPARALLLHQIPTCCAEQGWGDF